MMIFRGGCSAALGALLAGFVSGCGGSAGTGQDAGTNAAPLASIDDDREVSLGDLVALSGAGSTDPDGDQLTFAWRLRSKPTGSSTALSETGPAAVEFTADALGTYVIELVVSDGDLSSAPVVSVVEARRRPVADPGLSRFVQVGETVSLDGASSFDPEGEPVSFAWTLAARPQGSAATLAATTGAVTSFVADAGGVYRAELVVDAGRRRSEPASVEVNATENPPLGSFYPTEVYLFGTLSEGACYMDAIAHWSAPDEPLVGFDCYADGQTAVIRPSDGRLLYTNTFEYLIREFHCDGCPDWHAGDGYPGQVLDNDTALPSAPCGGGNYVQQFLVAPNGDVLHRCALEETWHDRNGNLAYDGSEHLLHLGADHGALTATSVVNLASKTSLPLQGLVDAGPGFLAVRALSPSGFWVVLSGESADEAELWHIASSGAATLVGLYPPLPPFHQASASSSRLDGQGRLFQFGTDDVASRDLILRRTIGGQSEVVYSEASDPAVKIHISALFTGP